MDFEDILYEKKDGTAKVIINRPKRGNALRTKTLLEMIEALQDAADDHSVGVIVVIITKVPTANINGFTGGVIQFYPVRVGTM